MMLTNADITLYSYSKDKFTRQVIEGVFWSDSKQSNIIKSGMATVDGVKILIPLESIPEEGLKFTTGRDLIVKGITEFEFDNTSQQTISVSHKALLDANDKVVTVTVSDDKRYGSPIMQHYALSCK